MKRLILMLLLLVVILVVGTKYFNKPAEAPVETPAVGPVDATGETDTPVEVPAPEELTSGLPDVPGEGVAEELTEAPAPAKPAPAPAPAPAPVTTEQWFVDRVEGGGEVKLGGLDTDGVYVVEYTLNNIGASVDEARLRDYFVTEADKRLHDSDPAAYAQACIDNPEKYQGHYPLLRPVTVRGRNDQDYVVRALATRTLWVKIEGAATLPLDLANRRWVFEGVERGENTQTATFSLKLYYGLAQNDETAVLKITKRFTLAASDLSLNMSTTLENLSDRTIFAGFDQVGATSLDQQDPRTDERRIGYAKATVKSDSIDVRLDNKWLKRAPGSLQRIGRTDSDEPIVWAGTTNKYFASILYMVPAKAPDEDTAGMRLSAQTLDGTFYDELGTEGVTAMTGVWVGVGDAFTGGNIQSVPPKFSLEAGTARTVNFMVFAGSKDMATFSNTKDALYRPIYKQLHLSSTIDFGACFCNVQWLSFQMMALLALLAKVMFGNYGLGIILLVVLVRLLLHPLTKKSQISMMKMQKLQPQIAKLKEKYADDKETLNREMMRIYKEQGASPLLGCLPMLLQMPILIALFTGINATVALRHSAFLPVWLTDLAAPDGLFHWSKSLPLIGNQFNLLPLLLCVVMYLQTKMNPQMSAAASAPAEEGKPNPMAQQQKMMKYMMPAMMLVFFYHAPSGLTLYFMASTAAGLLDQWAVRRHIRHQEELTAATETIIDMPGKNARGNRPKKPKPPFKTGM